MIKVLLTMCLSMTMAGLIGCNSESDSGNSDADQNAQTDGSADPVESPVSEPATPNSENAVPHARIVLDGRVGDWRTVPVLLNISEADAAGTDYRCRSIKIARDTENLYIMFALERGIDEWNAKQQRRGVSETGNVGTLYLVASERKARFSVSIGFQGTYDTDTDEVVNMPWVELSAAQANKEEDDYDVVLMTRPSDWTLHGAFKDKYLEVAVPLKTLNMPERASIEARFEPR